MPQNPELEISRERIAVEARKLATPIDFETLIKDGVLEKTKKREWYRVKDLNRLPNHAQAKISTVAHGANRMEVRFIKPSKKMQQLADKLSLNGQ